MAEPTKTKRVNEIVHQFREIAGVIEAEDIGVLMPAPDGTLADANPFVDKTCEAIERGGRLDGIDLASLIQYLADMLEE